MNTPRYNRSLEFCSGFQDMFPYDLNVNSKVISSSIFVFALLFLFEPYNDPATTLSEKEKVRLGLIKEANFLK